LIATVGLFLLRLSLRRNFGQKSRLAKAILLISAKERVSSVCLPFELVELADVHGQAECQLKQLERKLARVDALLPVAGCGRRRYRDGRLLRMAARRPLARNNHLEEAMALLIGNQAAFVEQIARNDQERLKLQRRSEEWQLENKEWQRKAEERFDKIEQRLERIEDSLIGLPETILQSVLEPIVQAVLEKLPKAVKKEIGFTPPA